jgi:hypothetical protein
MKNKVAFETKVYVCMSDKKNLLQQFVNAQPDVKQLHTSKYKKMEFMLLKWFR